MSQERYLGEPDVYEIEAVKATVDSRIATAEIGGISAFNDDERAEWLDGIEACETLEIALLVYDYLDDFIRDGLAVVDEIHSQISETVLPGRQRQFFLERAQIASFDSKRQLISEVERAVDEARGLQEKTLKILSDQALSVSERGAVVKRLNSEGASAELVNAAEQIVQVARERLQSVQTVSRIEGLLRRGETREAREVLGVSFGVVPLSEYIRLERNISQLQIQQSRLIAA